MNKQARRVSKVLDGPMSLGRSFIDVSSLTVDGGALPNTMMLDARAGRIQWTDQENLGPRGPYLFEFEHFAATECRFEANKAQMAADGVEEVVITVTCEDVTEATLPMAVYRDDELIGVIDVALVDGGGSHVATIEAAGPYRFLADKGVLDGIWSRAKFLTTKAAIVVAVEVA